VGPSGRRLLAGDTAAHSFEFQTGVLSCFDGPAYCLAEERGHFDSILFDVEYHRSRER
jgi:hypothetical protein